MSNVRLIGWLVFAITVSVAIHLTLDMRGSGVSSMVRHSTIAPSADTATAISIKRGGEPAIILSKASGEWRLVSPFHARADVQAVLRLLDALAFSPVVDSMDDSELRKLGRRLQDFGLQTPSLEIETLGPSGAEKIGLGSLTPACDGVYAAVGDSGTVFVAGTNLLATAGLSADGFRSRALFSVGMDEVGAFDVKREKGVFARFVRDGEQWRMSDPRRAALSSIRVRKFLSNVLDSRAERFVWPVGASNETETASASLLAGYGLDPESAVTLTLKGTDGRDIQVSFGKDAPDGCVYALTHNGGAVVAVDSSLKDAVLSGVDDLVDTRLFPVDGAAVSSISISDGDKHCIVAKGSDGAWRLDSPVLAPADSDAVSSLVERLLTLHVADEVDHGVMISLMPDVPAVGVERSVVFPDAGLESLRSRDMVDIAPSQVRRLVATVNAGSPVAVVYDANRRVWNVESSSVGGVADAEAIDALLAILNPLKATKVAQLHVSASELGRYGLEMPVCTISVDRVQEDSIRRNIRIGDVSPSGGRYATVGSSDAVFVIPEETAKKMMRPIVR